MEFPPPFISIIIATRNRGAIIEKTIQSILKNDYSNYEIWIIDQSKDNLTEKVVQKYLKDKRFHYIRSHQQGCSIGRNIGIKNAKGSICFITDDDCEIAIDCLAKLAQLFSTQKEVDIAFGSVIAAIHNSQKGFIPSYVVNKALSIQHSKEKHLIEGLTACMGVRRAVWEKLHGFDTLLGVGGALKSGAETDFTIRALLHNFVVHQTPTIKVIHHGFRTWTQGQQLINRYWFGTGALFGKLLRYRFWPIFFHLFQLAFRFIRGQQSAVSDSLGNQAKPLIKLYAFFQGFLTGLSKPINPEQGHFIV